jgi:hypothetical protein
MRLEWMRKRSSCPIMPVNFLLSVVSAFIAFKFSGHPLIGPAFACLSVWQAYCAFFITPPKSSSPVVLRLAGMAWLMEDFCRGWLITGQTGSGKTLAAINAMLWQVSKNCPTWGGVCVDDKGAYWETLRETFGHLGRGKDLVLLQVRPEDAPNDWTPPFTFNFFG